VKGRNGKGRGRNRKKKKKKQRKKRKERVSQTLAMGAALGAFVRLGAPAESKKER